MPIPSTYTYTVEEYKALIDEWIKDTTPSVSIVDGKEVYSHKKLPNPATLRLHTKLSKQTISGYKHAKEHEAYKADTERAYDHMESYGWEDLERGNGRAGNFMLGRVMKYSETQKVEQTNKTIEFKKDLDKMTESEANDILKDIK